MNEELIVLTEAQQILDVLPYLDQFDRFTFDTETTGTTRDAEIIGASLCAEEHKGYYFVVSKWDPVTKQLVRNQAARQALAQIVAKLREKQLIMHNAPFDCRIAKDAFGIELMPSVLCDTMIAAHILDEEGTRALKDLGVKYGVQGAKDEQAIMKASVIANGGIWQDKKTKAIKEMFKADFQLIGRYGAKDAILTMKVFNAQMDQLFAEDLQEFFFNDECMPLLRDVTYDLNETGLRVDVAKLKQYELEMTHEINRLRGEIIEDVSGYVRERPQFKLGSTEQMAWLLFVKLNQKFRSLNDGGKELAKKLMGKAPYSDAEKRRFIQAVTQERARLIERRLRTKPEVERWIAPIKADIKTAQAFKRKASPEEKIEADVIIKELKDEIKKIKAPLKKLDSEIRKMVPEKYIQVDKASLKDLSGRYDWVKKLLKLKSEDKLLTTYVRGLLDRVRYGIVYPRFNQTGTDSGRYSSSDPNFQNLPRDDKRIKSCILARLGKSFIGADYSQLEPRVFASVSQDPRLLECFRNGEDFYSVVGIGIFGRSECSAYKKDKNAFAEMFPDERQIAKAVCLAAAYGTTANKLAQTLRHPDGTPFSVKECQAIIDRYFEQFPGVRTMMLDSHNYAKKNGKVFNLYGRPRRLPAAIRIAKMFPNVDHSDLEYQYRTTLNLSMNFRVQASAASIVNRACIAFKTAVKEKAMNDSRWLDVFVVSQIHDEIIVEAPDELAEEAKVMLRYAMESTTELPGVALVAEPKIAKVMSELK